MSRYLCALLIFCLGCGSDPPKKKKKEKPEEAQGNGNKEVEKKAPLKPLGKPVARLTGIALWQDYGNNAIGADAKYRDKTIQIDGSVEGVHAGEGGRYYVGLAVVSAGAVTQAELAQMSPKQRKWFDEGYPPNVVCYLDPAAKKAFADLKRDSGVTVLGRCKGMKKDPDVWGGYVVVLEDCVRVVPPKK
jgi:hypothetical protein